MVRDSSDFHCYIREGPYENLPRELVSILTRDIPKPKLACHLGFLGTQRPCGVLGKVTVFLLHTNAEVAGPGTLETVWHLEEWTWPSDDSPVSLLCIYLLATCDCSNFN